MNTITLHQLQAASAQVSLDENFHILPHIPAKKLHNAIVSYGEGEIRTEDVLLLIDDTVFGSAKNGLVLTGEKLLIKLAMEARRSIQLNLIETIHFSGSTLVVNGVEIGSFALPNATSRLHFIRILEQCLGVGNKASNAAAPRSGVGVRPPGQMTASDRATNSSPSKGYLQTHYPDLFMRTLRCVDFAKSEMEQALQDEDTDIDEINYMNALFAMLKEMGQHVLLKFEVTDWLDQESFYQQFLQAYGMTCSFAFERSGDSEDEKFNEAFYISCVGMVIKKVHESAIRADLYMEWDFEKYVDFLRRNFEAANDYGADLYDMASQVRRKSGGNPIHASAIAIAARSLAPARITFDKYWS